MKDINKVILVGRLGGDPVQRQTKTGHTVVHFSLATTRKNYREDKDTTKENEKETTEPTLIEETQWHNIVSWGKQGEACALYLKKGNPVYVDGNLRYRNYEDKNGQTKLSVEIHAETVSFLGTNGHRKNPEKKPENRSENRPENRPEYRENPLEIPAG